MGIYQQVNFTHCFSNWIIMHASTALREKLTELDKDDWSNSSIQQAFGARTASNYLKIVGFAARSWGPYLAYLQSEFKQKVRAFGHK
jgi:hypothetical protein